MERMRGSTTRAAPRARRSTVSRPDGSKIVIKAEPDWKVEAVETCKAGFDEGILSLCLTILFCMWNPYRYNTFQ